MASRTVEATKKYLFHLLEEHVKCGKPGDPYKCAEAIALMDKRTSPLAAAGLLLAARVYRTVAYLVFDTRIVRYMIPARDRQFIRNFDGPKRTWELPRDQYRRWKLDPAKLFPLGMALLPPKEHETLEAIKKEQRDRRVNGPKTDRKNNYPIERDNPSAIAFAPDVKKRHYAKRISTVTQKDAQVCALLNQNSRGLVPGYVKTKRHRRAA